MSAYLIDYSDPLRAGFSIPAGGFNGPGGSASNTSLRLYGRGALEWGEAVDEDLVRLTENFTSASSPSSPITGQQWVERSLYYQDTVTSLWWWFDAEAVNDGLKWKAVGANGVVTATPSTVISEGAYATWDGVSPLPTGVKILDEGAGLYKFCSLGRYEPVMWRKRSSFAGAGQPVAPTVTPPLFLRTYDAATRAWSTPSPINITTAVIPSAPYIGMLWYDLSTGVLKLYTALGWQTIVGPSIGGTSTVSEGNIDLNGFSVYGLAATVDPATFPPTSTPAYNRFAPTKEYVDALALVTGDGKFVLKAGDTTTGALTILPTVDSGTLALTVNGTSTFSAPVTVDSTLSVTGGATARTLAIDLTATIGSTLTVSGATTLSGTAQVGGTLSVIGVTTLTGGLKAGSKRIELVADPVLAQDAATKKYVDDRDAVLAAATLASSAVAMVNPVSPKTGDIRVQPSPLQVQIYAGGQWQVVWPAQWV